ncbi:MAG: IS110 family transposase, partial [Actinobacteria bacterium]|nr:IS110 family transposase [Actinomycetota bacterium]
MPDVSSIAPGDVNCWIVFDVHKNSLVAGTLPPSGGAPEVTRLENTERAVRRFVERLGGPDGLAVAYEAGPCGYDLFRLLSGMGVGCDVIAPSLVPVRAGDRVKTDRRDAKKLVRLYRAGELSFVEPPSPEQEGLRDLVRCREDLRRARTAARHRVAKQLLRHGCVYREGKKSWTLKHQAWLRRQRLDDPLAQRALCHMLCHLDAVDAQLAAIDHELEQVATSEPWADPVRWLCSFRGIGLLTALGLLAEIGDFRRFAHPRELMSYLGLTPSEYSSGDQQHRGHITKCGNRHARLLLIEADLKRVINGIDPRHTREAADRLSEFDRPALVAWSREDRCFKAELAEGLDRDLPNSRLEWIDDAYALSMEDNPGRVAELIAGFAREPG